MLWDRELLSAVNDTGDNMKLEHLIDRLPSATESPKLITSQGAAFDAQPEPIDGYVPTQFEEVEWPTDATVLLIQAPGAVGKSAAAQTLAARLKWPLVRAEHAQVGSYTLSGLIQDALGFGSSYIQQVALGEAGIVVDSLDEAYLRAGTQNFLSFLENVRSVSGVATRSESELRRPTVILLSRSDTAELIRLYFADSNVPIAIANLSFFDLKGAENFVKSLMQNRFRETRRPEYNVHLASPGPFSRLRDDRFRQVMSVIQGKAGVDLRGDWDASQDFLGYAPVLIALAESLAVGNPAAERSALSATLAGNENDLLHDIVMRILDREQVKLSSQLGAKLRAILPASVDAEIADEDLYRASEQTIRVMSLVSENPIIDPPPHMLPERVRDDYEQSANQFVADHPFVKDRTFASVVFSDYVKAMTAMDLSAKAALEFSVDGRLGQVGPFFVKFVRRFADAQDRCVVPENLVEPLIQSWAQESELLEAEGSAFLQLMASSASLHFVTESDAPGRGVDDVVFEISDFSGAFHLRRGYRNLSVITDQGLILGSRSEPLTLGPKCILSATEVAIESETLTVGGALRYFRSL